jgi:nucleotide-binding universal stress UspA family protein
LIGKAVAARLTGRIYKFSGPEIGLMFSLSAAQAAATLASTIIGFEVGLYGDDVVNAVMVVIVVSLFVSSSGSNYYAPRIEKPAEDERRLGETILVPVTTRQSITDSLRLAGDVAEYHGGRLVPIVVAVLDEGERLESRRELVDELRENLRGLGLTGDPLLRVDRSISGGVQRAVLEENASLLVTSWPGRRDLRTRLLGGTIDEIISSTRQPVALTALRRADFDRILLTVTATDLEPGHADALRAASSLAKALALTRRIDVAVGPQNPEAIRETGVPVLDAARHLPGQENMDEWIGANATPSDLIVVPTSGAYLTILEGALNDGIHSLVVITANQGAAYYSSQGALGVTTAR